MINVDHFIDKHINEALSIAAICSDENISRIDAKLFTYIHVKSKTSPVGLECFSRDSSEEISAIEIMIGIKGFSKLLNLNNPAKNVLDDFQDALSNSIKNLDFAVQEGLGIELNFRSELIYRLKFHTDEAFRNEMLKIYKTVILPKIKDYSMNRVFRSFEKQREKTAQMELKLKDSLN